VNFVKGVTGCCGNDEVVTKSGAESRMDEV
jgi:hypothetical protein